MVGFLGNCNNRCAPCPGCYGSFRPEQCKLGWSATGNPYRVEVRAGAVIVSSQQSGFLSNPPSDNYSLWVQCRSGDDWVLLDSISWVQKQVAICSPCCVESGAYGVSTRYVKIDCGGPFWSRFNGVYQLTPVVNSFNPCPCSFSTSMSFSHSNPTPVSADGLCNSSGGWIDSGWLAGSFSYGPCGSTPASIFDVYWLHLGVSISLTYGGYNSGTACNTTSGQSGVYLSVLLSFGSAWLRKHSGSGNCWFSGPPIQSSNEGYVPGFFVSQTNYCGNISINAYQTFQQVRVFCPGQIVSIPVPTPLIFTADVL